MEVEENASATIEEKEDEENMDEGAGEGSDSSDSEDSDGNEAVHDPRIQQLELQVTRLCARVHRCMWTAVRIGPNPVKTKRRFSFI